MTPVSRSAGGARGSVLTLAKKSLFFPLFHRDDANLKHERDDRACASRPQILAPQQCPITILERQLHCLSAANPSDARLAHARLHALLDEKFFS
jgi:hypothetical protein